MNFSNRIQDARNAMAQAEDLTEELPMRRMANALATEPTVPVDTRTRQIVDESVAAISETVGLLKDLGWRLQQAVLKTNRPDTVRDVITDLSQAASELSNLRDRIQTRFRVETSTVPAESEE